VTGAIAVDDEEGSTDAGYGFVTGASSRDVAKAMASDKCEGSCKIIAAQCE